LSRHLHLHLQLQLQLLVAPLKLGDAPALLL